MIAVIALLAVRGARRRAATLAKTLANGVQVAGIVTECSTTSTVNNVPRWRIVVKFVDPNNTTRWFVDHRLTYSAPSTGMPVTVFLDPDDYGAKHKIVVEY